MLKHVALEVNDRNQAALFFTRILGLSKTKSSTLSTDLGRALFGKSDTVEMETWANDDMCLEVFITDSPAPATYRHLCLSVPDREAFVANCKSNDVALITAQKGDRELLFIKDFSGNLYEIV